MALDPQVDKRLPVEVNQIQLPLWVPIILYPGHVPGNVDHTDQATYASLMLPVLVAPCG